MINDGRKFWQNPTPENARELDVSVNGFARRIAGGTMAGATYLTLVNMLGYGVGEGLQVTWDELEEDPIQFGAEAFAMSMLGPIVGAIGYGLRYDADAASLVTGVIPPTRPIVEITNMGLALGGGNAQYPYNGLSNTEVLTTGLDRIAGAPGLRRMGKGILNESDAAVQALGAVGLGWKDPQLDASMDVMRQFMDDQNVPQTFFDYKNQTAQTKDFRRGMKRFTDSMQSTKAHTPAEAQRRQKMIMDALRVMSCPSRVLPPRRHSA